MVRWNEQKVACDQCGDKLSMRDPAMEGKELPLPSPWREVRLIGWAGHFVACSDKCEAGIRKRMERPEKRPTTVPPPPKDDLREVPTRPDIPVIPPPPKVPAESKVIKKPPRKPSDDDDFGGPSDAA